MFIEKAYTRNFEFLKYLPIPVIFLGMLLVQFIIVSIVDINIEQLMKNEIAAKGELRVFIESLSPLVIFFFLLLVYVRYIHKQSLLSLTTAREKISWSRVFFSFGLWGVITVALTAFTYFAEPESFVLNFQPVPFAIMAAVAIVLVPLQTSFEEYLFRGYLMQGIGIAARNRWLPLIITSVVFGVMHISNPEVSKLGLIIMIYYIGTGLFLGVMTLMDDGLELALGYHAANNLFTALLVTSDWTVLQTPSLLRDVSEPSVGFDVLLPMIIFYPLLLFIFSKKYKWHSWKEKLTGKIEISAYDTTPHNTNTTL